jgi:hypothetical protein
MKGQAVNKILARIKKVAYEPLGGASKVAEEVKGVSGKAKELLAALKEEAPEKFDEILAYLKKNKKAVGIGAGVGGAVGSGIGYKAGKSSDDNYEL